MTINFSARVAEIQIYVRSIQDWDPPTTVILTDLHDGVSSKFEYRIVGNIRGQIDLNENFTQENVYRCDLPERM